MCEMDGARVDHECEMRESGAGLSSISKSCLPDLEEQFFIASTIYLNKQPKPNNQTTNHQQHV
jgi:hypothetical protein